MKATVYMLGLALMSGPVFADWNLDAAASRVSFVSVKNVGDNEIGEAHYFKSLTGEVNGAGQAVVAIDLASVETMIPIRNERMQKMLFETVKFPEATIKSNLPIAQIKLMKDGESKLLSLDLAISLHGVSKTIKSDIMVTKSGGIIHASSAKPIMLNARDFSMDKGVGMLKEVAKLTGISLVVPVNFSLVMKKN